MDRCPLCRAALNGADTCRRCRADLKRAHDVERDGYALLDAAMHRMAVNDIGAAERLLRRALALHAAPEILALWRAVRASGRELEDAEAGNPQI